MSTNKNSIQEKLARLNKAKEDSKNVILDSVQKPSPTPTDFNPDNFETKVSSASKESNLPMTSIRLRESVLEKLDELKENLNLTSRYKLIEILTSDE